MSTDTSIPLVPFDAATDTANARVIEAQAIISKEVTQLGTILDQLYRAILNDVSEQVEMPDF